MPSGIIKQVSDLIGQRDLFGVHEQGQTDCKGHRDFWILIKVKVTSNPIMTFLGH